MPELPEVEVLVRHLRPLLQRKVIKSVEVRRARVVRPTSVLTLKRVLHGARFVNVSRRGKYLLFEIKLPKERTSRILVGHLGMTGRMYLLPEKQTQPKHTAVLLGLGNTQFIFEDTRYFGRMTLDSTAVESLGPEPLSDEFTLARFAGDLARSARPIKVKLLDQSLVAGIGNIYASEALFRAQISPRVPAWRLTKIMVERLWRSIRQTLLQAIEFGSTVSLDYAGTGNGERLFYYGQASEAAELHEERLLVYDRAGQPCVRCGTKILRIVQAGRSTFFCPKCQRG